MIAYNTAELDNKDVQDQTRKALAEQLITGEEDTRIRAAYPVTLYTPNLFIRIGLFLLTTVIVIASAGLLALMISSNANSVAVPLLFTGLFSIGILEYLVYRKRHFRSGVDDALLWLAAALILTAIDFFFDHVSDLQLWLLAFVMSLWCTLRFADRIMALAAYSSLLGILFCTVGEWGSTGRLLLPFSIMVVAAATGLISASLYKKRPYRHYRDCLILLKVACLLSFYAAGNIFVVRELQFSFFGWRAAANTPRLLSGFFWIWTLIIPFLYLGRGIQKKDRIFLWMGLALIAAAISTIRYYHALLPLEWAMVIGGALLITVSYTLIKYLRTPRYGLTDREDPGGHPIAGLQLESILIAETFPPATPPVSDGFRFGGGSGGGGGAGGEF